MSGSLDEKLDSLCLSLLELVSEIDEKKREQEKQLQDGYLCLAKARYAMGVDRVSKLQYPAQMTPVNFVECSKDQAEEDSEAVLFKSVRSKLYEGLAESKLTPAANVRKRRRAKLGNELDDAEVDAMIQDLNLDEDAPAPAPITVSDPIKWFGVLVPQSLKQAQACFTKAADTSCQICSLRNKLEKKLELYKEAKRQYGEDEATTAT